MMKPELTMQKAPIVQKYPDNWYILAFERSNDFPRPGSLITVDQATIRKHVEEVEASREEYDRQYSKIRSVFMNQMQVYSEDLFYSSDAERQWGIKSEIPLRVVGLVPADKTTPMMARCALPLFIWPSDVKKEDQFLDVEVNWATVINPIICDREYMITDKAPDFKKYFGFEDAKLDNGYYRVYQKSEATIKMPELESLVISLGLKEYSRIIKFDEAKAPVMNSEDKLIGEQPQQLLTNPDDIHRPIRPEQAASIEENEQQYLDLAKQHPMYQYTKRLYLGAKNAMMRMGLPIPEELDDDMYFEMFDTMLRTAITSQPNIRLSQDDIDEANSAPD